MASVNGRTKDELTRDRQCRNKPEHICFQHGGMFPGNAVITPTQSCSAHQCAMLTRSYSSN
jgi:hypothetical protein